MERHENAVGTNEGEPEMKLPQGLVHHAAGHLSKPEVRASKDAENGSHAHDHVRKWPTTKYVACTTMSMEGLRQEKAANAAADEHGDESRGQRAKAALIRMFAP